MLIFNAQSVVGKQLLQGELPSDKTLFTDTLRMAWPTMLESFLTALISLADTIMVGALGSYAIAAVGLTAQPRFLCLTIFFSISTAVSALTARRTGAGNRDEANRTLIQALAITFILALCIGSAAYVCADPILRFAGSQTDTHSHSIIYFRIIIASLVLQAFTLVVNAAQRGAGNTKIAMKTNLVSNAINIIFNFLLIEGRFGFPALGVRGAAIASVLGFAAAFILSTASVLKPDGYLFLFYRNNKLRFDTRILAGLYKVGSGALLEQIFLRVGFFLYAIVVANLGTAAFAAHQIGMIVISISFAVGDGLSLAGITLVGQSLGKKRPDLAKIYGVFCQRMGLVCSLTIALVYSTFGRNIYSLFSSDTIILNYGSIIMKIVAFIVIFQVGQVIGFGCLRGAGDTRYTAVVSLISVAIIRPFSGWLFVYPFNWGLTGAWLGLLLDQFVRFTLTWVRFKKGKWQTIEI
ncbi:MATE family efflux transporter [Treponema sp. OMZ 840]|uniref:MATE family efflux transporter n=1 Tax=Treponema sp. OMZ 840 TaxID=244313 RepID=UPI003D8F75F8